ncbi:hypothetical protein J2I47_00905 [Fibrella sp. HMF5335]|uniref:Uncharacterized protein n=1 Tax=Fibrella rubiginis TaxID=2817060 RepID=A0A939K2Z3_9BACT|nr:hypothetical protein [Fibrella rubiginis]MBO0935093.1 hypothetical protein [Fibrella rubiginis]
MLIRSSIKIQTETLPLLPSSDINKSMVISNGSNRPRGWFEFSEERFERLKQEIKKQPKDYILNVNEAEYQKHLLSAFSFEPLQLFEESLDIQPPRQRERKLDENERRRYSPYYWECNIACLVEGSAELWGIMPTIYSIGGRPKFAVSGSKITFQFNIQSQDPDEFNQEKNSALRSLREHVQAINNNASTFNAQLPAFISRQFAEVKEAYIQENSFFTAINVTKNPDAPKTYNVPKIEKRPAIQKPTVTAKTCVPQPTVDNKTYRDIIDCLTRFGLSAERKPSLYVGKDEEALRDLFLMQLEVSFDGGSVTGETFNRSGKTDILLKNNDGTNLFVGECKVWKGPKHYLEALTQLLEYLTWDDSKTALIIFVKGPNLSAILQAVNQVTLTHPAAVSFVGTRKERFLQFIFKLPQDDQKHIAVEVMLFHFDKMAEGRG